MSLAVLPGSPDHLSGQLPPFSSKSAGDSTSRQITVESGPQAKKPSRYKQTIRKITPKALEMCKYCLGHSLKFESDQCDPLCKKSLCGITIHHSTLLSPIRKKKIHCLGYPIKCIAGIVCGISTLLSCGQTAKEEVCCSRKIAVVEAGSPASPGLEHSLAFAEEPPLTEMLPPRMIME